MRTAPVVRCPVKVDPLGLKRMAYGDCNGIEPLPGLKDGIEIGTQQLSVLSQQDSRVGIGDIDAREPVLSQYSTPRTR